MAATHTKVGNLPHIYMQAAVRGLNMFLMQQSLWYIF